MHFKVLVSKYDWPLHVIHYFLFVSKNWGGLQTIHFDPVSLGS